MLLKRREFVVTLTDEDVAELREALDMRLEDLNKAMKNGGGRITEKHWKTAQELFNTIDYLAKECNGE